MAPKIYYRPPGSGPKRPFRTSPPPATEIEVESDRPTRRIDRRKRRENAVPGRKRSTED